MFSLFNNDNTNKKEDPINQIGPVITKLENNMKILTDKLHIVDENIKMYASQGNRNNVKVHLLSKNKILHQINAIQGKLDFMRTLQEKHDEDQTSAEIASIAKAIGKNSVKIATNDLQGDLEGANEDIKDTDELNDFFINRLNDESEHGVSELDDIMNLYNPNNDILSQLNNIHVPTNTKNTTYNGTHVVKKVHSGNISAITGMKSMKTNKQTDGDDLNDRLNNLLINL